MDSPQFALQFLHAEIDCHMVEKQKIARAGGKAGMRLCWKGRMQGRQISLEGIKLIFSAKKVSPVVQSSDYRQPSVIKCMLAANCSMK